MQHYTYDYLCHHYEVKNALFCIDKPETIFTLYKMLNCSKIDNVYLYMLHDDIFEVKRLCNRNIKTVTTSELKRLKLNDRKWTVFCIDVVNRNLYANLVKCKPYKLIVDNNFVGIHTFYIWEMFRNVSQQITIAKLKSPVTYKILQWEKPKNNCNCELSVILPVYNVSKYLKQCIDSLIQWKADYVEYLFVDDGSTDKSASIVKEAAKKDKRIKLLSKANGGCASARQYGLDHARGRYIGFVDPDDFIDPSMFEKLLKKAISGSYDITYCGYNEYNNETKKVTKIDDFIYDPYWNGTEDRRHIDVLMSGLLRIGIWRMIFLKDFLNQNKISFYTDIKRYDDLPFKVITLLKAKNVASVPEHLYYYRLERPGQDVSASGKKMFVHFDIFNHLDEWFKTGVTSQQLDIYHCVKFDTHLWALSKMDKQTKKEYKKLAKADMLKLYTKSQIKRAIGNYENFYRIKKISQIF